MPRRLPVEAILKRAEDYVQKGANVIDLGCLPDTPFPHLEETVGALKAKGYKMSVDSANADELLRGGKAGADFLLSLNEATLPIADQVESIPVLIPKEHGDLASLYRAMDALDAKGQKYLVDPVLDPINFGFTQSLERYAQVRRERPEAEMLMGTGNLTELTDADTTGITAILLGIASELHIRNVLVVQVSPHTRRTVEEHDLARRIMYASRAEHESAEGLCRRPAGAARAPAVSARLRGDRGGGAPRCATRISASRSPRTASMSITATAITWRRRLSRSTTSSAWTRTAPHAFYLGAELARAEIACRLGKRYAQDEPLDWGVAADAPADDKTRLKAAGHTLVAKKKREAS